MNAKIVIIVGCIVLIVFSIYFYRKHPLSASVTIHNTVFTVDLAVTNDEKTRGLSYRKFLKPKSGMLFLYDHKEIFPFWMQGMQFPLDFIWISDNVVVDITTNVPPATATTMHVVRPTVAVNKILEINAGEADLYGIQIGDSVTWNK